MTVLGKFINSLTTGIGITDTTIYTAPAGDACVIGINIAALDDAGVQVSIKVTDVSDSNKTVYFGKNIPIPTGSSLQLLDGQKIVLEEGDYIQVKCENNVTNGVDVTVSAIEKVNL